MATAKRTKSTVRVLWANWGNDIGWSSHMITSLVAKQIPTFFLNGVSALGFNKGYNTPLLYHYRTRSQWKHLKKIVSTDFKTFLQARSETKIALVIATDSSYRGSNPQEEAMLYLSERIHAYYRTAVLPCIERLKKICEQMGKQVYLVINTSEWRLTCCPKQLVQPGRWYQFQPISTFTISLSRMGNVPKYVIEGSLFSATYTYEAEQYYERLTRFVQYFLDSKRGTRTKVATFSDTGIDYSLFAPSTRIKHLFNLPDTWYQLVNTHTLQAFRNYPIVEVLHDQALRLYTLLLKKQPDGQLFFEMIDTAEQNEERKVSSPVREYMSALPLIGVKPGEIIETLSHFPDLEVHLTYLTRRIVAQLLELEEAQAISEKKYKFDDFIVLLSNRKSTRTSTTYSIYEHVEEILQMLFAGANRQKTGRVLYRFLWKILDRPMASLAMRIRG